MPCRVDGKKSAQEDPGDDVKLGGGRVHINMQFRRQVSFGQGIEGGRYLPCVVEAWQVNPVFRTSGWGLNKPRVSNLYSNLG
jgi:hypothetical protein